MNKKSISILQTFCGGVFTSGFFNDLLGGLEVINKPINISAVPSGLPIYLVSGGLDPVGNNTKGVLKTYQKYKQAGIIDVNYQFYDNARHELLNESNKEVVGADIITWINVHLN